MRGSEGAVGQWIGLPVAGESKKGSIRKGAGDDWL